MIKRNGTEIHFANETMNLYDRGIYDKFVETTNYLQAPIPFIERCKFSKDIYGRLLLQIERRKLPYC